MKTNIKALILAASMALPAIALVSCQKNDSGKGEKITVTDVCLNNRTSTTKEIDKARVGTMIRVDGNGLETLQKIYCNGVQVSFNPEYVLNTSAIFRIPGNLPVGADVVDQSQVNTIRIVTKYDDYTFPFIIQAAAPAINNLSHTLPRAGERLTFYGVSLKDATKVTFPGNVVVTSGIEWSDDGKTMSVVVPAGLTQGGAIKVEGLNGTAYSPNYFNQANCIFMSLFSAEPNDGLMKANPYCADCQSGAHGYHAWGSNCTGNNELPPTITSGHANPTTWRSFPAAAPFSAAATDGVAGADGGNCIGRYNFRSCASAQRVIGRSLGVVTGATPASQLAIQFDYYVPFDWACGRASITFVDNGNATKTDWMASFTPWWVNSAVTPFKMTGWRTATIPLEDIKNMSGQSYIFLVQSASDVVGNGQYANQGFIAFYNDTNHGVKAAAIPAPTFHFYFANLRIVPNVTQEVPDEN